MHTPIPTCFTFLPVDKTLGELEHSPCLLHRPLRDRAMISEKLRGPIYSCDRLIRWSWPLACVPYVPASRFIFLSCCALLPKRPLLPHEQLVMSKRIEHVAPVYRYEREQTPEFVDLPPTVPTQSQACNWLEDPTFPLPSAHHA